MLEAKLNELALRDGELKMTVPMLYVEARMNGSSSRGAEV
jgi:hypothetical protein